MTKMETNDIFTFSMVIIIINNKYTNLEQNRIESQQIKEKINI